MNKNDDKNFYQSNVLLNKRKDNEPKHRTKELKDYNVHIHGSRKHLMDKLKPNQKLLNSNIRKLIEVS